MFTMTKHKGVARHALHTIAVPDRLPHWGDEQGSRRFWKPVQHGALADTVIAACDEAGLKVTSETWHVQRKGLALLGAVEVEPTDKLNASRVRAYLDKAGEEHGTTHYHGNAFRPKGLSLVIGVRHSNDARWAVQFSTGARVQVCSNGLVITKFMDAVRRKHSEHEKLEDYVRAGMAGFLRTVPTLGSWVDAMREHALDEGEASAAILDMAEQEVIPWREVEAVTQAWRKPEHHDFAPRNAWSLYNAVTHAIKVRPPFGQVTTLEALRAFAVEKSWVPASLDIATPVSLS